MIILSDACTINVLLGHNCYSKSTNDPSRVIRIMPQLGASLMSIIPITLEVAFMLPVSVSPQKTYQMTPKKKLFIPYNYTITNTLCLSIYTSMNSFNPLKLLTLSLQNI